MHTKREQGAGGGAEESVHSLPAWLAVVCGVCSLGINQVVLSVTQDDFFARHRNANFGDLGVAVKGLLDEYQAQARLNENIQSIDDMHKFLDRYD